MRSTMMVVSSLVAAACGAAAPRYSYQPAVRSKVADSTTAAEQVEVTSAAPARGGGIGATLFGAPPPPPPVANVLPSPEAKEPEKLVIEAWIDMSTEDVGKTAAAIRARVEADGGRVVSENLYGSEKASSSGAMALRVPPEKSHEFLAWLADQGDITSRRILATDVSKKLFDQELALKNLDLASTRLQKLLEKDMPMADVLAIERELARIRGEIEAIKGEQRFLLDRVAFATIEVNLSREGGPVVFAPHAKLHPGFHLSMLTLLDPEGRERTRVGGGVTLHFMRALTLDLDIYPREGTESRTVTATWGGALYSDFLGGGSRRWLNPYLGLRLGFGYLTDEAKFLAGGEVGVELFKNKWLLVEAAARAITFIDGDGADVALHTTFGAMVPF